MAETKKKTVSQFTKNRSDGDEVVHIGKAKGSHNKITESFEDLVAKFRDRKLNKAFKAWEDVEDPKDKVKLYIELISFVTPKPQTVSMGTGDSETGYGDVLRRMRQEAEAAAERRETLTSEG